MADKARRLVFSSLVWEPLYSADLFDFTSFLADRHGRTLGARIVGFVNRFEPAARISAISAR
jgi:hypothetical protein